MSEQNGHREYRTRDLYRAALALIELGRATKPQMTREGRQSAPLLPPLPGHVALRLAFCRNSLEPIATTIEEEQQAVRAKHGIAARTTLETPDAILRYGAQAEEAERELQAMMEAPRQWSPPATVRITQLMDRQLPDEWLAALLAVGIVTGDLPSDDGGAPT